MFADWSATGPVPMGTILKAAGAAAAALAVLYVLKLRLRTVEVPFAGLWAALLRESRSSVWWRRLRRLFSFLVQALVAGLLFAGAADPRPRATLRQGRHVLVLVDASASMKALDGKVAAGPPGRHTRMDQAKEVVRRLVSRKGPTDRFMIVQVDSQVTALTGWERDPGALLRAVDRLHATDAPADLLRALRFSTDVLRTVSEPMLVLVGDGAYPEEVLQHVYWSRAQARSVLSERARPVSRESSTPRPHPEPGRHARVGPKKAPRPALLGAGFTVNPVVLGNLPVRAVLVGHSGNNIGVVAFNARRHLVDRGSYEVFARIRNYRSRPANVRVELYTGGQIPDTARLRLAPGEARTFIRRSVPATASDVVLKIAPEGTAAGLDDFPLDDVAYALVPERPQARILLVSEGNLYLEGALLLDERAEYDRVSHADYRPEMTSKYNVVVFDGYHGEPLPKRGNFLIFDPQPGKSPIPIVRRVPNPPIMWPSEPKHHRHPIMRFVTLKNVNTVQASIFKLEEGDEPLMMTDERGPVFAAVRHRKGLKLVVVGFSLAQTDWVIRVSFPVFVLEAIDWFLGTDPRLVPTYRTGRLWRIPITSASDTVVVVDPLKHRFLAPIEEGKALVYGKAAGYYTILSGREKKKVAANLADERESDIRVPEHLALGPKGAARILTRPNLRAATSPGRGARPLVWGVLLVLLGLGLVAVALAAGRTGALWALGAALALASGSGLVVWWLVGYLWSAAAVGALAVLLAEWLTYNRRVTV